MYGIFLHAPQQYNHPNHFNLLPLFFLDSTAAPIPDKLDPRKTQLASSIMSSFPSSPNSKRASSYNPATPSLLASPPSRQSQPNLQKRSLDSSSLGTAPPPLPPRPVSAALPDTTSSLDNSQAPPPNIVFQVSDPSNNTIESHVHPATMPQQHVDTDDDDSQSLYESDTDSFTAGDEKRLSVMVMSPGSLSSRLDHFQQDYDYDPQYVDQTTTGPDSATTTATTLQVQSARNGTRNVSAESFASTASNLTSVSTASDASANSQATYYGGYQQQELQPQQQQQQQQQFYINSNAAIYSSPATAQLNIPKQRTMNATETLQPQFQPVSPLSVQQQQHLPAIDTTNLEPASTQYSAVSSPDDWKAYPSDTPVSQYGNPSFDMPPGAQPTNNYEVNDVFRRRLQEKMHDDAVVNSNNSAAVAAGTLESDIAKQYETGMNFDNTNSATPSASQPLFQNIQHPVPISLVPKSPSLAATTSAIPAPGAAANPVYFNPAPAAALSNQELSIPHSSTTSLASSSGYSFGLTPTASKLNLHFSQQPPATIPTTAQPLQQQQQNYVSPSSPMPTDDLIAQYSQELDAQESRLRVRKAGGMESSVASHPSQHQEHIYATPALLPEIKVDNANGASTYYRPDPAPQTPVSRDASEHPAMEQFSNDSPPSAGKDKEGKHGRHLLGIFKGHKKKNSSVSSAATVTGARSRESSTEPPKSRNSPTGPPDFAGGARNKQQQYEGLVVQPSKEQVAEWEREAENLVLQLGNTSLQVPANGGEPGAAAGAAGSMQSLPTTGARDDGSSTASKKLSRFSALITGSATGNRHRSSSTSSAISYVSDTHPDDHSRLNPAPEPHAGGYPSPQFAVLNADAATSSTSVNNLTETFSKETDARLHRAIDLHEAGQLAEAAALFRDLADPEHTNHPLAQVLYGLSLRHGWGVDVNEAMAFQYLRLAGKNSAMLHKIIANTAALGEQDATATAAGGPAASLPAALSPSSPPRAQQRSVSPPSAEGGLHTVVRPRNRTLSSAAAAPPSLTAAELQSHATQKSASPTPPATDMAAAPSSTSTASSSSALRIGGFARGELTLATYELANCFRNGWGCEKDPVAALTYYEAAAHLGDLDAMFEAAWCYLNGFGTRGKKKDKYKAAQYYRMAESRGKHEVGNSWIWKDKYNPREESK